MRHFLKRLIRAIVVLITTVIIYACTHDSKDSIHSTPPEMQFSKIPIATETYESAGVFDVNNDGHLDIVSGAFWYEGPGFNIKHYIGEVKRYDEYYDDFSTIPMDVNGDGYTDFITGGWWGNTIRWRQNPGATTSEWPEHIIAECGSVETTASWDVDGDGFAEVVPNNPGRPLLCFKLNKTNSTFTQYKIADNQGHGIGFGDINSDGRGDFVVSNGWLEAPKNTWEDRWILHSDFELGTAGIPIIVTDLNGDGKNDLIVGQGHSYGLHWYEQQTDQATQKRVWIKHTIDSLNSQYHALMWTDITGDNEPELITGKRYRAHNDGDPGSHDDIGLFYFIWNGKSFIKHIISYGPLGLGKGTGIYFSVADLRKTGRKDIVVAGKDGLYVFYNVGR
jgi:hypothetical protein